MKEKLICLTLEVLNKLRSYIVLPFSGTKMLNGMGGLAWHAERVVGGIALVLFVGYGGFEMPAQTGYIRREHEKPITINIRHSTIYCLRKSRFTISFNSS